MMPRNTIPYTISNAISEFRGLGANLGFPGDSEEKNLKCSSRGDVGSIPEWGISLEEGMAIHPNILA